MPGGQEPKEKKRKRPDRREKEKPLLAVQVHNNFLNQYNDRIRMELAR